MKLMVFIPRIALFLGLVVSLVGLACSFTWNAPNTSGSQSGATGPSVIPSPSSGIASVSVGKYGEDDCANPSNNPTTVRVGCTARLTCTPKLADGTDAPPAVHGPAPDFFGPTSGAQFFSWVQDENLFNGRARALGPGVGTFRCTVKGVASQDRALEVVN